MTTISPVSEMEKPKNSTMRILGIAIWVSLAVGLFVSGYLSYTKATESHVVCVVGAIFNCDAVTNSAYSRFMGIPVAYLGFGMYLTLTAIYFLEKRVAFFAEYSRLLMFSIGLFAWLFSMWLVYVQFVLLMTLCPWCLSHETNMTILFAMLCYRLWQDMKAPSDA